MFFMPCNWKTLLFVKVRRYSEIFFNRHVVALFEANVSRENHILCVTVSPQ